VGVRRFDLDGSGGADEPEGNKRGEHDADSDDHPKSPSGIAEGNGDVHAPKAGDEGGDRDDERDDGKQFHDHVQVVGDNGGVRVHRAR